MRPKRWGPVAAFLIVCAGLARWFWFKLNPDTLAYFSMAHHYLRGEWLEAVNMGWSPMISWLTLPLLALGLSDVTAMRLLTLGAGVLTLYAVRKLGEDFELEGGWLQAVEYTAAGMIVMYWLLYLGPDLLEAALVLLYLRLVLRDDYAASGRGWVAGAVGAAAFLTKGYFLYFFLGHFTAVLLWNFFRKAEFRGRALRQWAAGMLVFATLSAPWFGAMSYESGRLTTGTTGAWNYRLVGPDSVGYPQYFGLIPPTGQHSSMWEEPSPDLLPAWSPLGSGREMKHQARLIYRNALMLLTLLLYGSILSFAALLAYAAWGWGRPAARVSWVLACFTLVVYPAGYLLIVVVDRYLWAIFLLILLMGAAVVQAGGRNLRRGGALLLGCGYFLSFVLVPTRMLLAQTNDSPWARIASEIERQAPNLSGKLAACGGWNDGVQIAWMLHMQFYGVTGPTSVELEIPESLNPNARNLALPRRSDSEIAQQVEQYRIDYFLALPACTTVPSAAAAGDRVWEGLGARLYRLHP